MAAEGRVEVHHFLLAFVEGGELSDDHWAVKCQAGWELKCWRSRVQRRWGAGRGKAWASGLCWPLVRGEAGVVFGVERTNDLSPFSCLQSCSSVPAAGVMIVE